MAGATPLVSVVIAAHDAAADLPRAVSSALAQSIGDLEVIVVDDASADGTPAVAGELAAGDRRVVLARAAQNLGPAGARNLGLDLARGAWIAVLDSDDAFQPHRLERLLRIAEEAEADMAADNLLLHDPSAGPDLPVMLTPDLLDRPCWVDAARFLLGSLPVPDHPRVSYGFLKPIFRRSFLDAKGIRYDPKLRFAEDFELYLRCLMQGASFRLIPDAGYIYTIRPGSLTDHHTARDLLALRMVDRRLLRRAGRAADDAVADALRRHLRSIDQRVVWRLFTDAIKAGRWRRARRTALLSPYAALLVASGLARLATKLARRIAGARGARSRLLPATNQIK